MEKREISIEELREGAMQYDIKKKEEKEVIKKCVFLYCIFIILLFLYMRLFNTKFDVYDGSIAVKYSTAWYIRYPAEFKGIRMEKAIGYLTADERWVSSFIYRCPNAKVVEFEEGITTMAVYMHEWDEISPVWWLILPDNINITEEAYYIYLPQKVTFKDGGSNTTKEDCLENSMDEEEFVQKEKYGKTIWSETFRNNLVEYQISIKTKINLTDTEWLDNATCEVILKDKEGNVIQQFSNEIVNNLIYTYKRIELKEVNGDRSKDLAIGEDVFLWDPEIKKFSLQSYKMQDD